MRFCCLSWTNLRRSFIVLDTHTVCLTQYRKFKMRKFIKRASLCSIVTLGLLAPSLSSVAEEKEQSAICNIAPWLCVVDIGAGGTGHGGTTSSAGGTGHGGSGSGSGGSVKPDKD